MIGIALLLSGGLIFLPNPSNSKELPAENLMMELLDEARFVGPDEISDLIINQDPTLMLIDIRDKKAYNRFSLEGAVNIPFKTILNKSHQEIFNRREFKKVLYGDSDIKSEQAWVMLRRNEYDNIYILKGGLVNWIKTSITPTPPKEGMPRKEFELYSKRLGSKRYFSGGSIEIIPSKDGTTSNSILTKKKKKKTRSILKKAVTAAAAEEGC